MLWTCRRLLRCRPASFSSLSLVAKPSTTSGDVLSAKSLSVASIIRAVRRHPELPESKLVDLLSAVRDSFPISGFSSEFIQSLGPEVAGERAGFLASCGDLKRRLPRVPETGRRDITSFVLYLEDQAQLSLDPEILPGTVFVSDDGDPAGLPREFLLARPLADSSVPLADSSVPLADSFVK